jgi:hypothetical protein
MMTNEPGHLSQYQNAAVFSRVFTQVLIEIKKTSLGYQDKAASSQEVQTARQKELALILEGIIRQLDAAEKSTASSEPWIQKGLIENLQKRCTDKSELKDGIQNLLQKLRAQEPDLEKEDFKLLDDIASAADAQASKTFQKMMRT